jgi:anthranilate phosphoribosyltransferase
LIGVYNLEIARIYTYLLQQEATSFTIIHGLDGYDEISLTGDTKVFKNNGEKILSAEAIGKRTVLPADIYGGASVEEAAALFLKVIKGEGSWAQNAVVIANAAMALNCMPQYANYETAYQLAVDSLESGKAYASLKKLIPAL